MVPLWLASALLRTAARRARFGPLRDSWTFTFEATVAFLRSVSKRAAALSPVEQRALWSKLAAPPSAALRKVSIGVETIAGRRCVRYVPKTGAEGRGVVLYLHGGSFIYGSPERSHREMITRIALASRKPVIGVDYRLAPEHPFPAALEDALAVHDALATTGPVVIAGDSAGGNLTLAVALAIRDGWGGVPPGERTRPAGLVALSPWVDPNAMEGSMTGNELFDWGVMTVFSGWRDAYAGPLDPTSPLISPGHAELAGLPPTLVTIGGCEMLRDQVMAFVASARAAKVDLTLVDEPDMVHNWPTLVLDAPAAERTYAAIGSFVASRL